MMGDATFLYRPIAFLAPERAVPPASWLDYTPFAFWIVDALRPGRLVELGCHSGNSYSSFAQAVQTLGLATACYAVDTWRGDPHAGVLDESVFHEWSEYHDRRYASFSTLIRSTFDEAREHFGDGSIDLLHIDGYHTFDAVAHDFNTWRPKMSDRGVVLLHDINVREKDFGAWRLWDRLKGEYPSFEFHHGYGLGVLATGGGAPEAVRWLLSLDAEGANTVRLFFSRLGAAVTAQYAAAEAQRTLRSELARYDERFVHATAEIEAVRADNSELRDALAGAEEARAARDAEVAQLASRLAVREAQRARPTILVLSHVGAWHPRAGNEYRLNRMLHWYRRQGYRVIPVIAPLPGEELSRQAVEGTAETFGNAVHVRRDGSIDHDLRDAPESLVLDPPGGMPQPRFGDLPEDDAPAPRRRELLTLERTFCHDAVISTVLHLQQHLGPHILQVEYIWMTRLLPLVREGVLKVVDTVDVFSSIEQKVRAFGLRDLVVEPREEAERLRRADLLIAIQEEEREELQRLAPSVLLVTAGVDFDVVPDAEGGIAGRLLYVASGNPRNCKGLHDFLRLAWPRIRRGMPHAGLVVVGGVAKVVAGREIPGVTVLGNVDDVTGLYRGASLVLNPVVAGTGVKIKTLEALSQLRPIVTWPAGVEGLDPRLAARCVVARDWYEFSHLVVDALMKEPEASFTLDDRAVIAELVSSDAVYASLGAAYDEYFGRHRGTTEPGSSLPSAYATPEVAHAD
jgi:hypothetical protein